MRLRVRAKAAKEDGKLQFTALLHHVSVDLLRSSYQSLKKRAAAGVDGVTWEEYGEGLEERLTDLHGRIHRGAYQAQPSRRVWIPKPDGRERPLGIAALEDKIVRGVLRNRHPYRDRRPFRPPQAEGLSHEEMKRQRPGGWPHRRSIPTL